MIILYVFLWLVVGFVITFIMDTISFFWNSPIDEQLELLKEQHKEGLIPLSEFFEQRDKLECRKTLRFQDEVFAVSVLGWPFSLGLWVIWSLLCGLLKLYPVFVPKLQSWVISRIRKEDTKEGSAK